MLCGICSAIAAAGNTALLAKLLLRVGSPVAAAAAEVNLQLAAAAAAWQEVLCAWSTKLLLLLLLAVGSCLSLAIAAA
jgi:hypothetical protein